MSPPPIPRRGLAARPLPLVGAILGLLSANGAQGAAPDPFEAGLRWSHAADPAAPWIPRDVAFVGGPLGGGELVWVAPAVETPRLQLFASAELAGDPAPLWQTDPLVGALGEVVVAAGDEASELYAAAQYPMPTASQRRTLVTRHDARHAAAGNPFVPRWTYDFGDLVNGPARVDVSRDGALVVAALFDAPRRLLHLVYLDPDTGLARVRRVFAATALRALVVAAGGKRVAVAAGTTLYVLDELGNLVFAAAEPGSTKAIALSADGSRFAHGRAGGVDVLHDAGNGYALETGRAAEPNEIATCVALSADASTYAVAWWNAVDGVSVRLEALDRVAGTRTNHYTQLGPGPLGLQNLPVELALTEDGSRVALGLWGAGDERPEVVLLETLGGPPILAADLPGSVYALALSADGTRVAVAAKDEHANLFSTTGTVLLYDTGERDLQLLGAARPGSALGALVRAPGATQAVFAFGLLAPAPWSSRIGELRVDFGRPHFFLWRDVVGDRASVVVPVSADPALLGLPLAIQAVRFGAVGVELVEPALTPPVL